MRIILAILFLIGLSYLILPGPDTINEFPKLPNSLKSQLAGDTVQNPNITAYFSDNERDFVTKFYDQSYREIYCKKTFYGFPNVLCLIPFVKLNHPPEQAFVYIRDQQESTYLEEYLLPFRESLFVNGYEPIAKDGHKISEVTKPIEVDKTIYFSKATVRFYPSPAWSRVLVYILVWVSLYYLFMMGRKVIKNG